MLKCIALCVAGLSDPVAGDSSSLKHQFLELLQNRQDAATTLHLAEARVAGGAASLVRGRPNDGRKCSPIQSRV